MLGNRNRALTAWMLVIAVSGMSKVSEAQFFGGPCNTCGPAAPPPVAYNACDPCVGVAPVVQAPVAYAPAYQTASLDCPCMKPVTETVYQDVQQVDYRPVAKTVKQPKIVTVMEERDVVTYKQVTEARTVDVPSYTTQSYTQCVPTVQNNSYWRTAWQPVPKVSPCQYDNRPGLMGAFNRWGLAFRNTFSPSYVARREFVPNVQTAYQAVNRTVQIPTTRQVTYNVARTVPVTVKQQVAVQKTVWEDTQVTVMEPFTTTKRVAVGQRTRYVYDDARGIQSAEASPTPATTAEGDKGSTRNLSSPNQVPVRTPTYPSHQQPQPYQPQAQPEPAPIAAPPVAAQTPSVIKVAGWQPTRRAATDVAQEGPLLMTAK